MHNLKIQTWLLKSLQITNKELDVEAMITSYIYCKHDNWSLFLCKTVKERGKKKWVWKTQAASFKSAAEIGKYL